jgi:hypothetical protein
LLPSVKLRTNLYLIALLALLLPGLVSCNGSSTANNDKAGTSSLLPCNIQSSSDGKDRKVTPQISLVIDGSMSMLGYVKTPNSKYSQTLDLLDTVLLAQQSKINYFRLEADLKPMQRAGVVEAQKPGFYTATSSPIAKALDAGVKTGKGDKAEEDRLVAIVTDLQPDRGDVNLIGKQILDRYLKKDRYAVAIWGIKSEFDGKVYPPDNAPAFEYATKGKGTEKGRPFYVLIAGPQATINNLVQQVKSKGSSLFEKDNEFALLSSSYSIDKIAYAQELKEAPTGFSTPTTIKAEDGKIIEDGGQPVRFLELSNRAEAQKMEFEFDGNIKGDVISNLKIDPVVTLQSYDSEQKKFVASSDTSSIKFEPKVTNNHLTLGLNLNPEKLKSGTYYLNADLQVADSGTSKNWEQWNDPSGKDGAKTQGLSNFIRSINTNVSTLTQDKKPTVARLCLAIQKN